MSDHMHPGHKPRSFWSTLARRAGAPEAGDIYRGIARQLYSSPAPACGVWSALAARVDPAKYCPTAVPNVAEDVIVEDGEERAVICSPRRNYLVLDPMRRELWHMMDGTRPIGQLAMHAFTRYHKLMDVAEFVGLLKDEGFLTDHTVGIYRTVAARLEERSVEGWGQRLVRTLTNIRVTFRDIDRPYRLVYTYGARFLFSPVFLLLWGLLVLGGLGAFAALFWQGTERQYNVLSLYGSVPLGLIALWAILFVSFVLHESAHALAVKHFGRQLHGGGIMLYYGMPAAFVDTSDIWRAPRPARMLVSAAGPMSDLLVGSLAALLAYATAANPALNAVGALSFKLAVACYVAVLFNANPLLELDGYFILMDWLRIPNLRARALTYIRGPLWAALRAPLPQEGSTGAHPNSTLRRHFDRLTREERILTAYGLLTAVYTVVASLAAFQFWREQLEQPIARLLLGVWWEQLLGWMLLLMVVLPILAGVALAGWGLARTTVLWLVRRGYGRRPGLLSATGLGLAAAITLATLRIPEPAVFWVAPMLWGVALGALLAVQSDYRGAAIAPALTALLVITACSALAAGMRAFQTPYWVVPETLSFVFLMLAGFAALRDIELRLVPPAELVGTVLLLMLAFAAGGIALVLAEQRWPDQGRVYHIIASAPAYFGAMALALMLPRLFDLRDSRMLWPWFVLWVGILAETVGYILNIARPYVWLDILVAGLWAASWLIHLATLRQITPEELRWTHEPAISEEQRLVRSFQLCYAGCYRVLRTVYGERRTRAFDDRMDVVAATAGWDVSLDRDHVRVGSDARRLELHEQGARFAEVLRYTVLQIQEITGEVFARRAIQAAYDALPWPERETAGRLCFPDTPWARDLSASFGGTRDQRLRLLRQLDLLIRCDDDELDLLAHAIDEQHVERGTTVLKPGQFVTGLWIVEAGEVIRRDGTQIVAELHRGDVFGDAELREGRPGTHCYSASMTSTLLFVPASAFAQIEQSQAARVGDTASVDAIFRQLERLALFDKIPRSELRSIARLARRHSVPARSLLIRQGQPQHGFFVIEQGQAVLLRHRRDDNGVTASSQIIERLGPGQYVGEVELLHGGAPTASLVTTTPTVVLAIPQAAIRDLLRNEPALARTLAQIDSGRRLQAMQV